MAWFERWRPRRSTPPTPGAPANAWPAQAAGGLLNTPARRALLQQIRQLTSVPDEHWHRLYHGLFDRYAGLVQELPASAYHHHAYRGGLLDHGLEVVLNGLKLRRGLVLPAGAAPEHIGPATEVYTYAVATGCLLHDSGKLVCDQIIETNGQRWFPWQGPLQQPYRMRFVPGRRHQLHQPASLLLTPLIIPPTGLTWLATDFEVWAQWLGALSGQDPANPLYSLIVQADRASVARDLGASPGRATQTPTPALHTKLLTALRHLLDQGTLALNRKGAAGWLTEGSLWLVSKTVADALRAHLLAEGHDGIPTHNVRLFEVLQEHGLLITVDGQAVWRCTVDDGNGWRHELTLLRLAPTTVWKPDAVPARWGGTVTPSAAETAAREPTPEASHPPVAPTPSTAVGWLNPALLSPGSAQASRTETTNIPPAPAPQLALGQQFLDWVKDGVQKGTLAVNDTTALVHGVAGGVFLVTPAIFKLFVRDHPARFGVPATAGELLKAVKGAGQDRKLEAWLEVQKAFQQLGLHERHPFTRENIRQCSVQGARRRSFLKGYWLRGAYGRLLAAEIPMTENPVLSIID